MRRLLAVPTLALAALLSGAPAAPAAAQDFGTLSGALLDQVTLRPLAGGVVSLVETGVSVVTDSEGRFSLPDLDAGPATIRVTARGYSGTTEPVEVTPGEESFLQIHLMPVAAMLDEVMVLTGRRASRNVPGSPPAEVLPDPDGVRAETAADLLIAQVPGLSVHRGGGSVGSGTTVRIRGVSSITQRTSPVIYLDGVRLSDNSTTGLAMRNQLNFAALDEIPASQVKRIRVLRGSSAGAMYGDSANGVILVETHASSAP